MSYLRGDYYTYCGGNYFYMFNLGDVPKEIVDAFVVMRFAEMKKKEIEKAEKFAIKISQGNFGCDAISKKHGKQTGFEQLQKAIKNDNKSSQKTGG